MDMTLTDSDWESSSDSGSSEHEEVEFSYGGRAQNIFSILEETIGKIDDFLSFERGFMYGDIVRSTTEPSGQTGRVMNINMSVNLESIHGKIVKEVDTKRLQKLCSISLCDYVISGPWLGRVEKIVVRVSVTLDDGSNYEVLVSDQDKLVAIHPNLLEDSQYSYYPGQRVQVKLSHAPRSTTWLCGNWRENQVMGTVCTVEAGLVYVDWVASIIMGGDRNLTAPQALQNPDNLTLLPCVSHASWQLGDWCILPGSSHCDIAELQTLNLSECHKTFQKGFNRNVQSSSSDELYVISKTKMKVDVMWQDGRCSLGVDSQHLLPVGAVNAHEFWPELFVKEKETCNSKRWGVVKAVNAKEQTVKVQWRTQVEKISEPDEASSNLQEMDLVKLYSVDENHNKNIAECSSFFLPKAAIGFIRNLASSLFGSQGSTSVISLHACCKDSEDQSDSEVVLVQEATESYDISESNSGEVDMATMVNLPIEGKEINNTVDSTLLENSRKLLRFRQFDMTNDCSDHHFLSSGKGLAQSQVTKGWVKKIQQEWSILEADLPS